MNIQEIRLDLIDVPDWNPNQMDAIMHGRLRLSIQRFGLIVPLVVRAKEERFETLGGAQRLGILRDVGNETASCVVIDADDSKARLLTQALNHIEGEDDVLKQADLLHDLLASHSQTEIASLLPGAATTLQALSSVGDESMADHLQGWEQRRTQTARLNHLTAQFTGDQLRVVQDALNAASQATPESRSANPNARGNAFYHICLTYLESIGKEDQR